MEILQPIFAGLVAGLLLAVLIGPVFFALIETSIRKGFVAAVLFALGILLSDGTFFLIAFFGLSHLGQQFELKEIMGFVGGLFLLGFGLALILKKKKKAEDEKKIDAGITRSSLLRSLMKGFLLNAVNPSVLFYWIGVVTAVSAQYEADHKKIFAFFICCITVVFCTDMLKAFLAFKLKDFITDKFMLWMNRGTGVVLMAAGAKLLWDVIVKIIN